MIYKYANEAGTELCTIDDLVGKSQSWNEENSPAKFAEMQEWLKIPGNEIEPLYSTEDIALKEEDDKQKVLTAQSSTCKQLLDDTQYIVDGDCDFPQEDIEKYKAWRVGIKKIMRGGTLQAIPPRPY